MAVLDPCWLAGRDAGAVVVASVVAVAGLILLLL